MVNGSVEFLKALIAVVYSLCLSRKCVLDGPNHNFQIAELFSCRHICRPTLYHMFQHLILAGSLGICLGLADRCGVC